MMGPIFDYFAMGGYGSYVWPSFAVTLVVLGALSLQSVRALKAAERRLARLEAQAPDRRKREP